MRCLLLTLRRSTGSICDMVETLVERVEILEEEKGLVGACLKNEPGERMTTAEAQQVRDLLCD